MAAISKPPASFAITPHKLSICVLVQVYAPPSQISIPFPFSSVSHHNRLGVFLLSLTKACDGIFEPTLDELIAQSREIAGLLNHWLSDHLTRRLSSLASPDDLFNFFADLRGILGGSDANVMDDDQIMLDPNSIIGMFIRRCLLAFNQMSFEGICHLLTNIGTYCKESISGYPPYELSHLDDSTNDPNASFEFENMEMDNFVYEKVSEDFEESKMGIGRSPFQGHAPKDFPELVEVLFSSLLDEKLCSWDRVYSLLYSLFPARIFSLLNRVQMEALRFLLNTMRVQDMNFDIVILIDIDTGISPRPMLEHNDMNAEVCPGALSSSDMSKDIGALGGTFLHTSWQVQGYLSEQAVAIEKHGSSFPLNAFESILKKLQQLAPELHRVHYLRYLNSLYHDDYPGALENLHRYFDYRNDAFSFRAPKASSGTRDFVLEPVTIVDKPMT
ncbi:UNVERIFIED_CONTAM: Anaphase-promoting complex subunit [Sesamum calycinum]|uniref:Anaphase-promoting complex subunit 5 n=1 Tax=Sesamum calycinum TaxID=2727403 RepID=A0AAW2K3U0_9LAMI